MSDIISRVWPEWHVEELLGQGSYGKVYRAVRKGHGHTSYAAIKVIEIPQSPTEASDLESSGMDELSVRSYFEQRARSVLGEVALMEALKGAPNVVSVEDYQLVEHEGAVGWTVIVRLPLLEPAKKHFSRVGQPDARETARLGIDICKALSACHAKGVIHRDVKPENVFWGEYGYLLGDFGIARRLGPDAGSAHTRAGAFPYMAPEVFAGKSYGTDVDTYSLGLIMHRYLNNGRAPFLPTEGPFSPSDSERAVALRLAGRAIPAPVNADKTLAAIVLRACNPDPDKRFGSAAEMGAALEAWLHGKTAAATPVVPPAVPAGPETVVLDPEKDVAASKKASANTARSIPQTAPPTSGTPQNAYASSGTVQAGTPAQAGQATAGRPQGQTSGVTSPWSPQGVGAQQPRANAYAGTMPTKQASAQQPAMAPQATAQNSSTSERSSWPTWVIIAVIAAAVVVVLSLSRTLFGVPSLPGAGGSHVDADGTTPTTQDAEPESGGDAGGDAIAPGKVLIDDDICTIQVTDISIDQNGDLRFDCTVVNHADRVLSTYAEEGWMLNGREVECYFGIYADPGETKEDYFYIESTSLPTSNLEEIYSVEGPLRVSLESEYLADGSIPDSPEHAKDGFVGSVLVDDDVCTVEVTGTYFDSAGDLRINLSIANHTDERLEIYDNGLWAVNGVYAETIFASTVDPGQTIDDYFFLKPDTLPVSEVDEIESLTGPMRISTENMNYYDISL